ncbi:hypothetical protein LENED_012926 [Lentinula edodes]|uniref:Uncharacterized protein n=1 Tax=Lentinula edodes TaxID=5353 RepID=A0A1Q3ETX6_LENED|nr:hypothetical protein LENED_012926 [Lentinula edodes]
MDGSPLSTFRDSRVSRASVLPSVVLPYLRRLDLGDTSGLPLKDPMLVLKLSSQSFLDSDIKDDISRVPLLNSERPAQVQDSRIFTFFEMEGCRIVLLAASAKGPIAILERGAETMPPIIKVFETLHDKYDTRPMLVHQGVSILLLDYVMVTALLLTTDIQEWMVVQKHDGEVNHELPPEVSGSDDFGPRSAPPASTSALQWRKVLYGVPLYPKRQSSASTASHVRFPGNLNQIAKIVNGEPMYPSLYRESSSIDFSSSESESDQETESEDILDTRVQPSSTPSRAPSPSAESVLYPLTTASAPSHTYLDPSFYNEYGIPPVPPLPAEYVASRNLSKQHTANEFSDEGKTFITVSSPYASPNADSSVTPRLDDWLADPETVT